MNKTCQKEVTKRLFFHNEIQPPLTCIGSRARLISAFWLVSLSILYCTVFSYIITMIMNKYCLK